MEYFAEKWSSFFPATTLGKNGCLFEKLRKSG
jgi:hypothetical protein